MKKDTRDLLKGIGFFTIIGLGATVAQKVYDWTRTPNSAYVIDANGDNRKDILLQNRIGEYTIILQQIDGTYIPLNNLPKETRDSIEAKLKWKKYF